MRGRQRGQDGPNRPPSRWLLPRTQTDRWGQAASAIQQGQANTSFVPEQPGQLDQGQGKTRRIQEISTRISLEVPLHMLEGVKNIYEISTIYFWASVGVRWGGGVRWSPLGWRLVGRPGSAGSPRALGHPASSTAIIRHRVYMRVSAIFAQKRTSPCMYFFSLRNGGQGLTPL